MTKVSYPFGKIDEIALGTGGAQAITIDSQETQLKAASAETAMTINLTIDAGVRPGAKLVVDIQQDSAAGDNITFGTGMVGAAITGVLNDRDVATFYYDGINFVKTSEEKAVDAA